MIGHLNPLKRGGEPSEIAKAALFLASDEVQLRQRPRPGRRRRPVASPPHYRQDYGRTFCIHTESDHGYGHRR